ncbi:hypothetical protein NITHO_3400004 [Nitrolancea hollandica Lb]|uniref:Uncharacterized protein n=1 Tax=Nitrolancea hollandica Lb TaxID=1129897 RepID=I4EIA8_9BACT|nr:hypothetical protein NITHO_3400004 [Nitrolancea hollandica Lb]
MPIDLLSVRPPTGMAPKATLFGHRGTLGCSRAGIQQARTLGLLIRGARRTRRARYWRRAHWLDLNDRGLALGSQLSAEPVPVPFPGLAGALKSRLNYSGLM